MSDIVESSQPEDLLSLQCPRCLKKYKSRSGLNKHVKTCSTLPDTNAATVNIEPGPSRARVSPTKASQGAMTYSCNICQRNFANKSNLTKHVKTCSESQRRSCRHCGAHFATFAGLRAHESRTHRAEEASLASHEKGKTGQEILQELARAEAAMPSGLPLYSSLIAATGLTRDQIRHRRDKPIYRELLEIAKEEITRNRLEAPVPNRGSPDDPSSSSTDESRDDLGPQAPEVGVSTANDDIVEMTLTTTVEAQRNIVTPDVRTTLSSNEPSIDHDIAMCNDDIPDHDEPDVLPENLSMEVTSNSLSATRADTEATDMQPNIIILDVQVIPPPNDLITGHVITVHNSSTPDPGELGAVEETPAAADYDNARCNNDILGHDEPDVLPESPSTAATPNSPNISTANAEAIDTQPNIVRLDVHVIPQPNVPITGHEIAIHNSSTPELGEPGALEERPPATTAPDSLDIVGYLRQARDDMTADNDLSMIPLITDLISSQNETYSNILEEWLSNILQPPRQRHRQQRPPSQAPHQRNYGGRHAGTGIRADAYKKAQDLFRKDKKLLADLIFSGKSIVEPPSWPTVRATEEYFASAFETQSPPDDAPVINERNTIDASRPISPDEVANAKLGWSRSAPGPDGVTTSDVKRIPDRHLALLFTIILYANVQLPRFKKSRTILIFKKGDRANPANWRPITIASMVQRLLHRILAKRLSDQCTLNLNQRGFKQIDGTMANILILESFLKSRAAATSVSSIIGLDVTKAFDTVSHNSIRRGLTRMGVDNHMKTYIMSSLQGNRTSVRLGGQSTREFVFNRGVKQGDPISPLLFNIVMDEFIAESNAGPYGGTIPSGERVASIAFADDLLLLEDDPERMVVSLDKARKFLGDRGMAINASKCFSASTMRYRGALKPVTRSTYSIDRQNIPAVTDINPAKYLGHNISSHGVLKANINHLEHWLSNILRAPLKPSQRLAMIKEHAVPKVVYFLQGPHTTAGQLKAADLLIKAAVKRVLHLHIHTPDAALYAAINDGGLGIPELRSTIPKIALKRINKLRQRNDDPCLAAALSSPQIVSVVDHLERICRPLEQRVEYRQKLMEAPTLKGLEQTNQDPASTNWQYWPPNGWSGKDFVKAVHLRFNVLPTVGIPSNPPEQRRCRAGCNKVETLAHVLQQCPNTHWQRISRHNEVANKVERHCRQQGWEVIAEPHVRHQDGTLFKPDLAIQRGNDIIICDIGVNWEGTQTLTHSRNAKKLIYNNAKFFEAASVKWPDKRCIVEPIILGARGIWPDANQPAEDILNINMATKSSCVNSVLKWGPSIHSYFMRSVWRRRGRR